jgi:ATP/maltotriose-dependent transcriptional regulator MalT
LALRGGEANDEVMAALAHAKRSACRGDEVAALAFLTNLLMWGPTPVSDALAAYDHITQEAGDDRRVRASVSRGRAVLLAMRGDFDAARAEQDRCVEFFRDIGLPIEAAEAAQSGSEILAWAGDKAAAADLLARASDELASLKEVGLRSTHRGMLARLLVELGRLDEAEAEAIACREMSQPDDRSTEILWRSALALIHSQRGELREADQLSLEAVRLVGDSDFWNTAAVFTGRAEVLSGAGRHPEAAEAMAHAIEIYRAKGATSVVERLEAVRSA